VSGLFGGGGSQSATPRRLQGMELQRSSYGEVIPLVYGQARVAPTLVWYDDFTAIRHSEDVGGKGGGGTITSYSYTAAMILGLCEGPIASVQGIWADKSFSTDIADYGFTAFLGASGQATWSYLTTVHPTEAIGYDLTAYVAGTDIALGSLASMPNFTFIVRSPTSWNTGGIFGALPSVILEDYLTDPGHGAQFPYLADLTAYGTYCQAMGLFLSPVEQTQRAAADFIAELMQITNSNVRWSAGQLEVVPYADAPVTGNGTTYTPDITPVYEITDDDLIYDEGDDPVRLVRRGQSETYNRIRVEYLDKATGYNTAIAEAWDDADIALNGERPMQTLSFHGIDNAATARLVAQLVLQRQRYITNTFVFRLRADFSLLDPMDLLDLTDLNLGLDSQLVRIISITDEDNNFLELEVEEVPIGVHNSPRYDWSESQGYAANYEVAPGDIDPPLIFVAPPYLVSPEGGTEILIAGSGGDSWGGATVWASFDDLDYRVVGVINGAARYGETLSSMGAVADPDTTTTLQVELADPRRTLEGTTTANADELRNLLWVDGEVMSFRDADLVSAGVYDLEYFRRGVYGSSVAAHSTGAPWALLGGDLFSLPFDPGQAGQTLYLKFTSFNLYGGGEQALSDVDPVTFTIPTGFTGYSGSAVPMRTVGQASVAGFSAFKTSGIAALDSAVRTVEAYANGCAFSFTSSAPNSALMFAGLDYDDSNFTSALYANHCFRFSSGGTIKIFENNVDVYTHGATRTPSDTFTITYDGRNVRYFINGSIVWASTLVGKTMFALMSFSSVGGQFNNIRFAHATGVQGLPGNLTVGSQWVVGSTGTQGNFEDHYNGTNADSSIVLGGGSYPLGPYGQSEPLWRAQGTGTGANGGWNNDGDILGVDPTKSYRSVVWFQWNGTGTPTIAFGFDPTNTNNLNGTSNTNPFVFSGNPATLGITANKWYLAVGIMQAMSYGTVDLGIAGIYDPDTGQNIYNGTEFKFAAAVPTQMQRVHQTGANNGSCVTYFTKPRFEEITGNEPTIRTLLSPSGLLAYLDEVDTGNMASEAASAVRTASSTSNQTVPNDSSVKELLAITITTTGGVVSIDVNAIVSFALNGASGAFTWLTLTIDGSSATSLSNSLNFPPMVSGTISNGAVNGVRTHTPAAGTHTYRLTAVNTTDYGGSPTMSVAECYMKLREYKR